MRILFALALWLAAGTALAFSSYAFPRGIVSTGDGTAALVQRAGEPTRVVELKGDHGATVGERWEYNLRDKQVNFTIRDGRIVKVEELR